MRRQVLAVIGAMTLIAVSGLAASAEEPVEPETTTTVVIDVVDYDALGRVVSTSSTEHVAVGDEPLEGNVSAPAATDAGSRVGSGGATLSATGNGTTPAPSARSGCRTVSATASKSVGPLRWYSIRNSTYYCYNKTTRKVSNARATYSVVYHDGLNDIQNFSQVARCYTYFTNIICSGFKSAKTWKVQRTNGDFATWWYPQANVYAHGDGSAYWSTVDG